jgi:hypothetical protein
MAVYETIEALKDEINDTIVANNAGLITAQALQELLHDIVDTLDVLGGSGSGSGETGDSNGYTQTINLTGGEDLTRITTTLAVEPFSVMILDSDGKIIDHLLDITMSLVGGVYVLDIYSLEDVTNGKLKIIY